MVQVLTQFSTFAWRIILDLDGDPPLHGQREQLAVALQDLDAESQRLIYPILRLKMVQHILFAALKETRKNGTSFVQAVRKPSLLKMLERVRDELNNDPHCDPIAEFKNNQVDTSGYEGVHAVMLA